MRSSLGSGALALLVHSKLHRDVVVGWEAARGVLSSLGLLFGTVGQFGGYFLATRR